MNSWVAIQGYNNSMLQFVFLGLFSLVLFASHFFIYFSLISFLGLISIYRFWTGIIIFVLPALFIISSVFAHYYFNLFTRGFYFVSGLWLATATNLIVSFLVIWIVIGLSKIYDFNLDLKVLGYLAIIFSLLFMFYGIWNTYNTKIKNITVGIKNLPIEWQNKKAVQISDVHLGYVYGKNYLQSLVNKINDINSDIVVNTGDLFDAIDGIIEEVVATLNKLNPSLATSFIT